MGLGIDILRALGDKYFEREGMVNLREIGDRNFERKRKVDVRAPRVLCSRRRKGTQGRL